jgi:hypothetical protein
MASRTTSDSMNNHSYNAHHTFPQPLLNMHEPAVTTLDHGLFPNLLHCHSQSHAHFPAAAVRVTCELDGAANLCLCSTCIIDQ